MASDRDDRWGEDDRGRWDDDREGRSPERVIRDARAKVAGPGIALIVTGAVSLLLVLVNLVQYSSLDAQFDEQVKKIDQNPAIPADQKQTQKDLMIKIRDGLKVVGIPMYLLAAVVGVVTIVAGVRMRNLRSRGLVMTGSILSMIPCVSGCCVLGLPIGIWALVVLSNPDVKEGFRLAARAGDGRGELPEER